MATSLTWVAVKELKLSYCIGESLLFTIHTQYGNLTQLLVARDWGFEFHRLAACERQRVIILLQLRLSVCRVHSSLISSNSWLHKILGHSGSLY